MELSKKEIAFILKHQTEQQKRNSKRRLTPVEESLLAQFHDDYRTIRNELQLKVCKRLVNLLYLFAVGPDSFGITTEGLHYLHDHDIKLRSA
jgi:hypothetical protein